MPSLVIRFDIEGERQVAESIDFAGEEIKDFRKPLREINTQMLEDWDIKHQGSKIGEKWERLKEPYRSWKAKNFPGRGILIRTGAMNKKRSNSGWRTRVSAMQTTLWNQSPYFKYHQSNKTRKSNLPRRVMMKLADKQKTTIIKEFQKYLNEVRNHFNQ